MTNQELACALRVDGLKQWLTTGAGVAVSVFMPLLAAVMASKIPVLPPLWWGMLLGSLVIALVITRASDSHSSKLTAEQRREAQLGKLANSGSRLRGSFERGMGWQALIGGFIAGATGGEVAVGLGGLAVRAVLG